MEEEDEQLEAQYIGVFPPPYTPPSPTPGPLHTSSPSDTSNWLYAPNTRKKRKESRPSSSVKQQSSPVPSEDGGDDKYDDLDSSTITQQPGSDKTCGTPRILLSAHRKTPLCQGRGRVPAAPDLIRPDSRWDWIDGSNFELQVYNFDESSSGIKVQTLTADSRECEFFNYFWDEDILETIVAESNHYVYFMRGGKVFES
ncbi:hypothetical protein E2C01_077666 [Portunus trituberculatus]|uniref:Uncharacterized protein n=1 Tax=Portunus trituberculatus TaxID=210409 RepID=A0A5B7IMN5_PORTR|nr:hypothetical protein [Portunus trituberculatus]